MTRGARDGRRQSCAAARCEPRAHPAPAPRRSRNALVGGKNEVVGSSDQIGYNQGPGSKSDSSDFVFGDGNTAFGSFSTVRGDRNTVVGDRDDVGGSGNALGVRTPPGPFGGGVIAAASSDRVRGDRDSLVGDRDRVYGAPACRPRGCCARATHPHPPSPPPQRWRQATTTRSAPRTPTARPGPPNTTASSSALSQSGRGAPRVCGGGGRVGGVCA